MAGGSIFSTVITAAPTCRWVSRQTVSPPTQKNGIVVKVRTSWVNP